MENRMLTVFIVDDEKLIRDGMKKLFKWEENGFRICGEAANGRDALQAIQASTPDIVLTDLRMPVMDGLALTAALWRWSLLPDTMNLNMPKKLFVTVFLTIYSSLFLTVSCSILCSG